MARPRSKEKESAILAAAVVAIATHGVAAPTTAIAKTVGVAEGTIFRYFPTKDDLLNAVYLHLQQQFRDAINENFADGLSIRQRVRIAWMNYVEWGLDHPLASKALNQLSVSDRVTPDSHAKANALFPELLELCEGTADPALEDLGTVFLDTVFFGLADTIIGFATLHPDKADICKEMGFEMLWTAMNKSATAPLDYK